ncbi:MAG: argB [Dehalococcoidia bacterium]|nr:argB [Dehalococcoidia bacterium]
MPRRLVIKIGGSILGQHDTTLEDLAWLQSTGVEAIVVHGGGKTITEWLDRQKVPTQFVNGLRVTDEASIGVVVAVLAGLINKQLVATINAHGGRAVGLSGVDAGIVRAEIRDPALGLVGHPCHIHPDALESLLREGFLPVLAPVGVLEKDGKLTDIMLNINADAVAAAVGGGVHAQELLFFTDVPGVLGDDGQVMPSLGRDKAMALIASGVISGGMVPKVEACLQALGHMPSSQVLDGRQPHALRDYVSGRRIGTTIAA